MAPRPASAESTHRHFYLKLLASAAILALLPACTPSFMKGRADAPALNLSEKPKEALTPTNPLHKATAYWAEQHRKRPGDPQAALNYAKNLKAIGSKTTAISVLQQAHAKHPRHAEIASEYGRLVLEQGRTQLALRILKAAEQGGQTDWRVMSAQGTAHAKLGEHETAQKYFAAALRKKPDSASLRNNLALSYAMSGSPQKAETLLRQTIDGGYDNARVRQNLALVLGLQGKFKESEKLASVDLSKGDAQANVSYLRTIGRDRAAARTQLASQASVTSAGPYRPATIRVASAAPAPTRLSPSARDAAPGQVSSKTLPLPWTVTASKAQAPRTRVAAAKAVPMPRRKPAGPPAPGTAPATKPAQAPASPHVTAAKQAPLPWHQPAQAAPQGHQVAVASWSTRVIPEAGVPKAASSWMKPMPGQN